MCPLFGYVSVGRVKSFAEGGGGGGGEEGCLQGAQGKVGLGPLREGDG